MMMMNASNARTNAFDGMNAMKRAMKSRVAMECDGIFASKARV